MDNIPHTQHPRYVHVQTRHIQPHLEGALTYGKQTGMVIQLDKLIEDVEPIPKNYGGFVDKVCLASRRYIPRGCRTNHITSL